MATFVTSQLDELAKLRAVLVQRSLSKWQFLLKNGSFLDSPVLWISMPRCLILPLSVHASEIQLEVGEKLNKLTWWDKGQKA